MPKYVAHRALALIDSSIKKPKVLILGVAYKSGVRDVRETPVLELRNSLISNGAEVGWFDPLVVSWEGTAPVELDWKCDIAILATNQPGVKIQELLARGVPVLDCTNSFNNTNGVFAL